MKKLDISFQTFNLEWKNPYISVKQTFLININEISAVNMTIIRIFKNKTYKFDMLSAIHISYLIIYRKNIIFNIYIYIYICMLYRCEYLKLNFQYFVINLSMDHQRVFCKPFSSNLTTPSSNHHSIQFS
jgi:hypothetical protein